MLSLKFAWQRFTTIMVINSDIINYATNLWYAKPSPPMTMYVVLGFCGFYIFYLLCASLALIYILWFDAIGSSSTYKNAKQLQTFHVWQKKWWENEKNVWFFIYHPWITLANCCYWSECKRKYANAFLAFILHHILPVLCLLQQISTQAKYSVYFMFVDGNISC